MTEVNSQGFSDLPLPERKIPDIDRDGIDIEDFFDIFEDFDIPSTTDGSYRGKMAKARATELFYEQKFEERLATANVDLKKNRTRVSIIQKGRGLYLRSTLPLKPGDSNKGKETKQYDITLKVSANLDGLKTAIEQAYKLGSELDRKMFVWSNWIEINDKIQVQTGEYYYENLEKYYFTTHKKSITSEHTISNYLDVIRRYIGFETTFDKQSLEAKIKTLPDWCVGLATTVAQVVIKEFGLGFQLEIKKPKVQTNIRTIPDDVEIIKSFELFKIYADNRKHRNNNHGNWEDSDIWILYRWCYGMLATYGLRPRELFVKPDIDWWLNSENINHSWKVHQNTKTGYREAIPFVSEWVELFDLKNPEVLAKLASKTKHQDLKTIQALRKSIARWFNVVGVKFQPYDLRHGCAIRAHLVQGIPIKAAADNLGHSVEQHTQTYQKWIDTDKRKKAFDAAITKKSQVEILQDEISNLKLEIETLKIENQRLKLQSQINK
jgi:integrase